MRYPSADAVPCAASGPFQAADTDAGVAGSKAHGRPDIGPKRRPRRRAEATHLSHDNDVIVHQSDLEVCAILVDIVEEYLVRVVRRHLRYMPCMPQHHSQCTRMRPHTMGDINHRHGAGCDGTVTSDTAGCPRGPLKLRGGEEGVRRSAPVSMQRTGGPRNCRASIAPRRHMTVSWYMIHASADAALTASRRLRAASIGRCIAMLADLPFQWEEWAIARKASSGASCDPS